MARHTLYAIPGTWEAVAAANAGQHVEPGTPVGLLRAITDRLDPNIYEVIYVNYPASFGPISGGGAPPLAMLGNPSYRTSRDQGVDELTRLINERPGSFGIIGYSQGGAVAALTGRKLLDGSLTHRQGDCKWIHTFGSPHRPAGRTFHLGNPLGWGSISGDPIGGFENAGPIDWFDYCMPLDIYGDTNPDTYLTLGYDIGIDLELGSDTDLIAYAGSQAGAILDGIANSGDDPLTQLRKVGNTANEVARFMTNNPHIHYHDDEIIPGWTAVDHSWNHLNYWGPLR